MKLTVQQAILKGLEQNRMHMVLPELCEMDEASRERAYADLKLIAQDETLTESECYRMMRAVPKRYVGYFANTEIYDLL